MNIDEFKKAAKSNGWSDQTIESEIEEMAALELPFEMSRLVISKPVKSYVIDDDGHAVERYED